MADEDGISVSLSRYLQARRALQVCRLQLMALIHVEKASMTGARGLWAIETR
jgi:hypothetical protein